MMEYTPEVGDRVRVDIPDERDPDHGVYHGRHGYVRDILIDDAGETLDSESGSVIYRVEFDDQTSADFRHHDLRPPVE